MAQFADDTSVYLQYDEISLNTFVQTMQCVEAQMGLQVSYEKTTVYRVGSIRNSEARLYTQSDLTWSNNPIDTLGVKINCDGITPCEQNYVDIMRKLQSVCQNWYNRL